MRNFDLTIILPYCAKTIGEASLDVAHVLMTIAKHSKRLKKWEYISYLKNLPSSAPRDNRRYNNSYWSKI